MSGVADPVRLAAWMVRFWFVDQDLFEVDPVRYRHALGEMGLTAYRQAVAAREHEDTFALQYVRERLAVLDGDTERIVALLGGDLTRPHQFVQVAEAMAELGREDDVLAWCERGIAETQGWQTARLYDLACETHARRGQPLEVLRLRRSEHERMPSLSSYHALDGRPRRSTPGRSSMTPPVPSCASATRARSSRRSWVTVRRSSRGTQRKPPNRSNSAATCGSDSPKAARPLTRPTQLTVYQRVADQVLEKTDRRAYAAAVRILKRARDAAKAADDLQSFSQHIATLREQHRRRPTMIAMLDKAGLR